MLLEKIREELKKAVEQKDRLRSDTLRLLLAEIHNRELEKQNDLTEEEIVAVVRKETRKRKESIAVFEQGKRDDLVRKEQQELEILNKYLPQEMTAQELEKIVEETLGQIKPQGPQDFGKVMGVVMGKVKGKADGKRVAEMVKKLLA